MCPPICAASSGAVTFLPKKAKNSPAGSAGGAVSEQLAAQAQHEAARTDEVHDDGVVDQVVGRLVRLVKVNAERSSSGRARLLGARQANEARVKLCARAVRADRCSTVKRRAHPSRSRALALRCRAPGRLR